MLEIIKQAIQNAIMKMLPMDVITKQYLEGEYDDGACDSDEAKYAYIKDLIDRKK